MMTVSRSRLALALYGIAVGFLGWGTLALLWHRAPVTIPWFEIVLFALLSIAIKSLGFQVAPDVTHSLVGIADLAVLFARGPLEAGLVAAISGGVCQVICAQARRPSQWTVLPAHVLFGSGLNALMAVVTGWVYGQLGGRVPLTALDWRQSLAVLASCVMWFTLDHLGWAVAEWLVSGAAAAVRFVRDMLPYSLRVELMPLPFAAAAASAYSSRDPFMISLMVLALLIASYILRRLMASLHEERRHVQELSTVDALNQALLSGRFDRDEMARLVYHFCAQVLDATHFCMQVRAHDRPHQPGQTLDVPVLVIGGQPVAEPGAALGDEAFRWMETTRRAVVADSPAALALASGLTQGHPAHSGLYAPILRGDEYLGLIALHSPHPHAYSTEDAGFLELVATHAALGLHTARLYRREQQRASQLEAISQISRKVAAILDLETLFADTVKLVQETFGYYQVAIFTVDQPREIISFQASSNPDVQQRAQSIPWGRGIVGHVAATGESLLANDVRRDPRYLPDVTLPGVRSEMAAPLRVEDRILGVIDVQCEHADVLTELDHATLLTLADQIAIAVEDSRLYEEQQEQAWVSTALLEVANLIQTHSELDQTLNAVLRLVPALVGIQWCALWLWDHARSVLTSMQSHGLDAETHLALTEHPSVHQTFPLLATVLDLYASAGALQPVTELNPRISDLLPTAVIRLLETTSLTALPLHLQGRLLGVLLVAHPDRGAAISERRMNILAGIAHQLALAIEASMFYQQAIQQQRSEREMELAREIQASFVPECCPELPDWQFAVEWRAARGVGGDFYDMIPLDDQRLGLVIADVSDKGVAAALYMALARTVVRIVAKDALNPAEALRQVNAILMDDSRSGMFVSMFYGVLELNSGLLTYARAGHNPPLLLRAADRSVERLLSRGVVLGILDEPIIDPAEVTIGRGDALVLYTDGVTEAENSQYEDFGEQRLQELLRDAPVVAAPELVQRIDAAAIEFVGDRPQFDDFTLFVVVRDAQ